MTNERYDVIVVGGGPAGMAAAITATENGARVALIDEGSAPGGQIWRDKLGTPSTGASRRWKERLASSRVTRFMSTSVVDAHRIDGGVIVTAERAGRALFLEAHALILATGARERFLPFPGWTLPNVVGVGGVQALVKSGLGVRGKRVVLAGSGPLLLPVAASLASAGAKLAIVAEQTDFAKLARYSLSLWKSPAMLVEAARLRAAFAGTSYATSTWVTRAEGNGRVESVTITNGRTTRTIACDLLCAAFGLVPNTELARLLGCIVRDGAVVVDRDQMTSVPNVYCAGEPTGIGGVDLALVEGQIAGAVAVGRNAPASLLARRVRLRAYAAGLDRSFALREDVRALATPDTIACRCEDVRFSDLDRGWTARQAKLYTRAGMGACQGRICGSALECVMGWPPDSVRPPIQPARLSTLLADVDASASPSGVS